MAKMIDMKKSHPIIIPTTCENLFDELHASDWHEISLLSGFTPQQQ